MSYNVAPNTYSVTVVGGSFSYGVFKVTDAATGALIGNYPAHFVLNAAGAPLNPSTEDTQQLVLAALQNLATILGTSSITLTDAFGASPTAVSVTDVFGSSLGQIAS